LSKLDVGKLGEAGEAIGEIVCMLPTIMYHLGVVLGFDYNLEDGASLEDHIHLMTLRYFEEGFAEDWLMQRYAPVKLEAIAFTDSGGIAVERKERAQDIGSFVNEERPGVNYYVLDDASMEAYFGKDNIRVEPDSGERMLPSRTKEGFVGKAINFINDGAYDNPSELKPILRIACHLNDFPFARDSLGSVGVTSDSKLNYTSLNFEKREEYPTMTNEHWTDNEWAQWNSWYDTPWRSWQDSSRASSEGLGDRSGGHDRSGFSVAAA